MKSSLPFVLAAILLTAACGEGAESTAGANDSQSSTAASGASSSTPDAPSAEVTFEESCNDLLGENLDGPLMTLDDLMRPLLHGELIDDSWPDKAYATADSMNSIASKAGPELRTDIEEAVGPLNTILETESFSDVDVNTYAAPTAFLMDTCRDVWGDDSSSSAGSLSSSGTLQITGDVVADLEAAGIILDDPEGQVRRIGMILCSENLDTSEPRFGTFVDTFAQDSPNLVRIAVAYECPERAEAAEEHL